MEQQAAVDEQKSRIEEQVNAEISRWRQGDVLYNLYAVRLVDLGRPLSAATDSLRVSESIPLAAEMTHPPDLVALDTEESLGYAVVSQTCDVVRDVSRQPFVQLCPVIKVPESHAPSVRRSESTLMVWLPEIGENICADLTRTFTAEKSIFIGSDPLHGVTTDEQIRNFAHTVSRRFGRFAFPDDLNDSVSRMRSRLLDKHGKGSDEGYALRQIFQIRASGYPDWNSPHVEVVLHFILHPGILSDAEFPAGLDLSGPVQQPAVAARGINEAIGDDALTKWVAVIRYWVSLCTPVGVIKSITFQISDTESFTLEQMRNTEQLDLEYLSLSMGE
jgi:hypothetical protein